MKAGLVFPYIQRLPYFHAARFAVLADPVDCVFFNLDMGVDSFFRQLFDDRFRRDGSAQRAFKHNVPLAGYGFGSWLLSFHYRSLLRGDFFFFGDFLRCHILLLLLQYRAIQLKVAPFRWLSSYGEGLSLSSHIEDI